MAAWHYFIFCWGGTLDVYTNNKLQVTMLSTHLKDPLEQLEVAHAVHFKWIRGWHQNIISKTISAGF